MTTYHIGYGFGLKSGHTLSPRRKSTFRLDLLNLVNEVGGEVLFDGAGYGYWEGQREEAAAITFQVGEEGLKPIFRNGVGISFHNALSEIAGWFQQECIACSVLDTTLCNSAF